jgi:hypothetical protein
MNTKFWCPGCDDLHMVSDPPWQVTGKDETLTISPSVLVYERQKLINEDLEGDALLATENVTTAPRCHSFVRNGHIEFLSDCTHKMAGQTVPLGELPDWLKTD